MLLFVNNYTNFNWCNQFNHYKIYIDNQVLTELEFYKFFDQTELYCQIIANTCIKLKKIMHVIFSLIYIYIYI